MPLQLISTYFSRSFLPRGVARASHGGLPKHRVSPFNRLILNITRTVNPVPSEVR